MAQFLEFIGNHLLLSAMWVITLGAIMMYHQRTGASSVGPQKAVMLINRQGAVVVDVREKKEFDTGPVSYTHLRAHEDQRGSRMPSSA